MAYDVWQSCVFVPGLTSEECASWVQAWGTIAAIAAAVGIAWWQRRQDRKATAASARAKAEIAATSVLLKVHPILGSLQHVEGELRTFHRAPASIYDPAGPTRLLEQLPFPTDGELIALADFDARCARWLIRARNLTHQAEQALRLLNRNDPSKRADTAGHLADLLALAVNQLEKAETALDQLAPDDV